MEHAAAVLFLVALLSATTPQQHLDAGEEALDALEYETAADELMRAATAPSATDAQKLRANLLAWIGTHRSPTLVLEDCTFDGNYADTVGGALYLASPGALVTLRRNLFFANTTANRGGAVDINCATTGTVVFENTTFVANGGNETVFICGDEEIEFVSSTFMANVGDIARLDDEEGSPGVVRLRNSIIDDSDGATCSIVNGAFVSLGGNVTNSDDADCGFDVDDTSVADPQLASALADNGGPTLTIALEPGSAAIGAGDGGMCPATDQRGYLRDDGACDAGAFEYGATPP